MTLYVFVFYIQKCRKTLQNCVLGKFQTQFTECSEILISCSFIKMYMVHFKARHHFQVSNGKIDIFAAAGAKKVCNFTSKEKMFLSFLGTKYLEIHGFPCNSQILSPKIGHFFKMLKMHEMKIGQIQAPFWDLKLVNFTKINVFLGSLFLDLKGTSFLLM